MWFQVTYVDATIAMVKSKDFSLAVHCVVDLGAIEHTLLND